ncbi:MAG: SDR family oxidoreductase [Chloroflexota bacterium]
MQDKTVIVTGATAGIGKVTALEIARMGATVTIVGRSETKCKDIVQMVQRETNNQRVDYLLADLSSIAQTKAVAAQILDKHERLDVLVNNVGAIFMDRGETEDGFENTFALNHLVGYFLLTHLLLDRIKASAPARIVSVSSSAHFQGVLNFDDLGAKAKYGGIRQYAASKLMNVAFTYELARRLEGTDVTATALHPGVVATNFGLTNNRKWWAKPLRWVFDRMSISEADGAKTSIYLATSPEVEGVTGKYFDDCKDVRSLDASYDQQTQQKLWAESERLLGLH